MKTQSVINLDPIDRQNRRRSGPIGRFFKTRHYKGKGIKTTDPFGHYLYCGRQRSGKTVSALWELQQLKKKYEAKGKKVILLDNLGISKNTIYKNTLPYIFNLLTYDEKIVYIILVDEIQSWYYKDTKDRQTLQFIEDLGGQLDQLGKRQIYLLSTAQVYGKVHKILREQCLYMVHCRKSRITNKVVNDFIDGDDILCDELGRWSGEPSFIKVHGLPTVKFDTHKLISSDYGSMLTSLQ